MTRPMRVRLPAALARSDHRPATEHVELEIEVGRRDSGDVVVLRIAHRGDVRTRIEVALADLLGALRARAHEELRAIGIALVDFAARIMPSAGSSSVPTPTPTPTLRCPGHDHRNHAAVTCAGSCCTACGGPIDENEECRC